MERDRGELRKNRLLGIDVLTWWRRWVVGVRYRIGRIAGRTAGMIAGIEDAFSCMDYRRVAVMLPGWSPNRAERSQEPNRSEPTEASRAMSRAEPS